MTITEVLENAGISITEDQSGTLNAYMSGILEANENINLTAIKDRDEFIRKHYLDSLSPLLYLEYKKANRILDLGTGGGFPGIPLAVMSEDKEFVLLDSLNKRLKVIDKLAEELGIVNIKTVHGRAEDLARQEDLRESFDICVSRAVAELRILTEYALPFVKPNGYFLSYKSKDIDAELKDAANSIDVLGGTVQEVRDTVTDQRIVVIKKTGPTPSKYPRKAGEPKKKPL